MRRVLVLYVFHIYNERVQQFIKDAIFKDDFVDFYVISNNKNNNFEVPDYVKVLKRDNIGFDFGGWSDAVLSDDIYKQYSHFIFINSSVSGPFLDDYPGQKWTDIFLNGLKNDVKLFGSTINSMKLPKTNSHVQSYLFAMDLETLEYLIQCKIFDNIKYTQTFIETINTKEILMSRKIIQNGWNIGSLLKIYQNVDFRFLNKQLGDYNIQFYDDICYPQFQNVLWTKPELVFLKGNRFSYNIYEVNQKKNHDNVGFIILRSVKQKKVDQYWKECYQKIRLYFPENPIIIIDDDSDPNLLGKIELYKTKVIQSKFKKRGEFLPYYYYLKKKFFGKAVIIHDSVFLNYQVNFQVEKYKLLWEFEHNWDDVDREINLIKIIGDQELLDFYQNKHLWKGCFGCMSVVSYDFLQEINKKYNLSKLLNHITTRQDRCAFERIIACLFQINTPKETLFGNIHQYCPWGVQFENIQKMKHLPVIKVWTGR